MYQVLIQTRCESIICEKAPYLLELARYIHLNPLKAGMVGDLKKLNDYRWAGHYAIIGIVKRDRQDIATVLAFFGKGRWATWARRLLDTFG